MFAIICTRPDIAQALGAVSRYMTNSGEEHWIAVKRTLRYIRGTSDIALCYGGLEFTVRDYVDLDFVRDLDKKKSTTGCVYTCGSSCKLGFKTADRCGFIYNRSRIHGCYISLQESYLDTNVIRGAWAQTRENYVFCDS